MPTQHKLVIWIILMLIHNMLVGMIDVVVHVDVVEIFVVDQVSTLNF